MLRLVKHDSLFSSDTKPIIWTFVAGREKSSFTEDGNRHFEGCGGKRGCGGSMSSRSVHFLAMYCNVQFMFMQMFIQSQKQNKTMSAMMRERKIGEIVR